MAGSFLTGKNIDRKNMAVFPKSRQIFRVKFFISKLRLPLPPYLQFLKVEAFSAVFSHFSTSDVVSECVPTSDESGCRTRGRK